MNLEQILIISLIVIFVLSLLYFIVERFFKDKKWSGEVIDRLNVLQKLNSTKEEIKIKSALIDADKLLDFVLKKKGIKGDTLGERLKSASNLFDRELYNQVWEAHKLRNKLVHEVDFAADTQVLSRQFWTLRTAIVRLVK
jgi:hypothetical protein